MKTVMVVDDVPANVDVVLGFLFQAGYRVLVAEKSGWSGQFLNFLGDLFVSSLKLFGLLESLSPNSRRDDFQRFRKHVKTYRRGSDRMTINVH